MEQTEKITAENIEKYGYSVILIEQYKNTPSFGYTIGLWESFKHPEIISFGLTTKTILAILNNAGQKVKENESIKLEVNDDDIFESAPAFFISVDKQEIQNYFGYGMEYNKYKEFPAIQLVWADRKNKFPWEKYFETEFANRQIILNKKYNTFEK